MTDRLSKLIQKLTPRQLEQLENYASLLVETPAPPVGSKLDLSWVGCMKDAPEKDGVAASHAITKNRIAKMNRDLES